MYKWHVHSALGRGRPVASDISRVADGIVASLRQFSLSASRSAEDDKDKPRFTISRTSASENGVPRVSRFQKSANAVGEISSLAPTKPRGIDARSLAAKPLQIRRIDGDIPSGAGRGGGFASRGTGRGGLRGRGGAGVRGRGGARGRGKGRRGGRGTQFDVENGKNNEAEGDNQPLTTEEQRALDGGLGRRPYIPQTTLESLLNHVPAVATSKAPSNITRNFVNSLQVMTGDRFEHTVPPEERNKKIHKGNGTMVWTEAERKAYAKAIPQVSQEHRNAIVDALVTGKHILPMEPKQGDILGTVDSYLRRNESYLAGDAEKLKAKLKGLLATTAMKAAPAKKAAAM